MDIGLAVISLTILVFSAILHEIAHGYVANRLGDPTARLLGRLTLNPIPHIDPMMSIVLPLILIISGSPIIFGAAKPVPVDPFNLRDPKKDMAIVSMAGPLTNFLIAIIAAVILKFAAPFIGEPFILGILFIIVKLNLLLGIFNLLPIPPLDGSKIFATILPDDMARTYLSIGSFGMFILFFLLLFPLGPFSLQSIIANIQNVMLTLLGLA